MNELSKSERRPVSAEKRTRGLERTALDAKVRAQTVHDAVVSLLCEKIKIERSIPTLKEGVELTSNTVMRLKFDLRTSEENVTSVLFQKRGQYVPTRFGHKRALFYREKDEMLCLSLFLGCSSLHNTRLYVPMKEILALDERYRTLEIAEIKKEERDSKVLYAQEEKRGVVERNKMEQEELLTKTYIENVKVSLMEEEMGEQNNRAALKNAHKMIKQLLCQAELKRRIDVALKALQEQKEAEDQKSNNFFNDSNTVRSMKQFATQRSIYQKEKKEYINELACADKANASGSIEEESRKRVSRIISDSFGTNVIKSMLREMCTDALQEDEMLKETAE